ncbi:hypothetical protein C8P63_12159 [Melghirimyces profundicolus]|uniref:Coat F domain-containing protein n=1 Tax=Melghirimyces profundicolus TaxID=1242148 RepID=A0A2T6BGJ4_9BACL|nr:hypothetical protein [Melghirimyces profundicolus]PTX55179.1 hypothetical protein C8P63_12159 [Melghirimyces profundicolus]
MEQLTQMELLHLQDLIGAEALAVRKCQMYEKQCKSGEMKQWFRDAAELHRAHIRGMMKELRRHDGRERKHAERKQ